MVFHPSSTWKNPTTAHHRPNDEGGDVYTWGSTLLGRCGRCGNYIQSNRNGKISKPKQLDALRNVRVVDIFSGGSDGQLGHDHTMNLLIPRLVIDLEFGGSTILARRKKIDILLLQQQQQQQQDKRSISTANVTTAATTIEK